MIDKNLFQIGVLAKISGVHIRSLRYYEKLGILKPEYIDKNTKYRYYSYRQMRIVEAIQYCVELDIPLKEFKNFINKDNTINYPELLTLGKIITEQKLSIIQKKQSFIEKLQKEMIHAKTVLDNNAYIDYFDEQVLYCIPFDFQENFHFKLLELINNLESKGFSAGYNNGILLKKENDKINYYLFIDIKETILDIKKIPELIRIPKGNYLCLVKKESSISNSLSELPNDINKTNNIIIIENELFEANFPYKKPLYELKYLIEKK